MVGPRELSALAGAALSAFAAGAAEPDATLKVFLAHFADMAAHGAAEAMVGATRFPLKNRVYQEPQRIDAAGFKHHFARNGFREEASCLKATPPQRAEDRDLGDWEVRCDGNYFFFVRESGGWRFSGFENVNE